MSCCSKQTKNVRVHSNVQTAECTLRNTGNQIQFCYLILPNMKGKNTVGGLCIQNNLFCNVDDFTCPNYKFLQDCIYCTRWFQITGALFGSIVNSCSLQHYTYSFVMSFVKTLKLWQTRKGILCDRIFSKLIRSYHQEKC